MFRDSANKFSLWTIFELGKRNPIFSNLIEGDEGRSIKLFEDAVSNLYPDKIYTVKMYPNLLHRKGGQKFIVPGFEYSFQFPRDEMTLPNAVPISGPHPSAQAATAPVVSPYAVDMAQRINLSDHISLISAKSKAESDNQYYLSIISDKTKEIADLKRQVEELESTVNELEDELDAFEEEAEEEEKAQIGKSEDTSMEAAIASVIKENGGALLENLLGQKGVKGAPDFSENNMAGNEDTGQGQDSHAVNGVEQSVNLMSLPLTKLNEEMMLLDSKWKQHLCKIILIGQQKPITFKMFMMRLENF